MQAVGKLIAVEIVEQMQAGPRPASVAHGPARPGPWLVVRCHLRPDLRVFGVLGWIALYQISRPLASMTDEMNSARLSSVPLRSLFSVLVLCDFATPTAAPFKL